MVPIRCIISTGIDEEITLADPLLPVNDMELMFIEKASIQSEGESPILTWIGVLAADVGEGVVEPLEPLLPPHAVSAMARHSAREVPAAFSRF